MEIIHVVLGKANPDRLNGINKVVFHLAGEQHRAGRAVQVWGITPNPVHDYPSRAFKTVLFGSSRFPFALQKQLKKAVLEYKDAVFHLHGGWVPAFSTLARWLASHGIRYVITPHGAYNRVAMERSRFTKLIYFWLFEKPLLKSAYAVHSLGESEVKGVKLLVPGVKSFLIPYGFDRDTTQYRSFPDLPFTIGFVGRLDLYTKGLDLLLEAFARFAAVHQEARLWIIGDGDGKSYLEQEIERRKLYQAELLGKKYGAEKNALISRMHLFAHPSRNEGLPTAVLEAASLGVPVVVTPATNVATAVAEYGAGEIAADGSAAELYDAFEKVYQSIAAGTYAEYGKAADLMLTTEFSWPLLVRRYDKLYE